MGQAFILLGTGIESIKTGILSPGALIAIGVGMVALSGPSRALRLTWTREQREAERAPVVVQQQRSSGLAVASSSVETPIKGGGVTINIEGRSMRGLCA